ncbi:MAG: hypothetical protein AAGG07_03185 [Planctomycetota bacterium]
MIRTRWTVLGCVVTLFGLVGVSPAQDTSMPRAPGGVEPAPESEWIPPEEIPSSEAVLARFVEVSGGKAAIAAHKNRRLVGTIRNDESGFRARITLLQQRPDLIHMKLFIPGAGTQLIVYDGEIAWEQRPDGAHTLLDGGRLRDIRTNSHFAAELEWETFLTEHETVGYTEVDGMKCVQVRATAFTGREMFLLFSLDNGMLVGRQTYQSIGSGGDVLQLMVIARYEVVDGVALPKTVIQRTVQGDTIIDYSSYQVNIQEFPSLERPAEVNTLLEARNSFGNDDDG